MESTTETQAIGNLKFKKKIQEKILASFFYMFPKQKYISLSRNQAQLEREFTFKSVKHNFKKITANLFHFHKKHQSNTASS